jgi:uncharacterized membrane protein YbhN (UPF0104 family)
MAWLGLLFTVCAVGAAVIFSERAAAAVRASAALIPLGVLHRVTGTLTDAVRRYATHHREMARVIVMSVAVQVIRVLQAWCLGRGLGIDLPLALYFAFIPVIVLIMQLPISINGIGTTQAAFAWLFVPQGAPASQVFALSVLFLVLGIVGTLPGGLLYGLGEGDGGLGRRSGVRREGGRGAHGA